MHDSVSFWQRIRIRRRVSVMDDGTLNEMFSFRLSGLGLIITMTLLFVLTVALLSVLIVYTPVRNILPGYNQNLRDDLMMQSQRVDSLSNSLDLQRQYLSVIRDITAGEVSTDSVQTLDSLQLIAQEQLMQLRMEATEEFIDQYEQKEKDNMLLFDVQNVTPAVTLFRPVHGVVTSLTPGHPQGSSVRGMSNGVRIQTPDKENVCAVLAGTIVYVSYDQDNTYTAVLQHANYISIYHGMGVMTKQPGASLQAGETFGIIGKEGLLDLQLWKEGEAIRPEEVIAF